jgi:chemotaxis protein CheC
MSQGAALSEPRLDALREFGNIGSAHAATSLSMMIGQEIEMRVPELEVVPLTAVSSFVDPDGPAVGLYFKLLDEDCREDGHVYLIFPEDSALKISDMLMMREIEMTKNITEEEQSALMEVGNVLLSFFGDVSAELLGITMLPSPPEYQFGMAREMINSVAHSVGSPASRAIVFKTALSDAARLIKGYFVLLPEPATLDNILALLEAKTNVSQ